MLVTVELVAPASALSKDADLGLLECCWRAKVTATNPSAASPSRTVSIPAPAWIANWPVATLKDKVGAAANSGAELPTGLPAAGTTGAFGTLPPSDATLPATLPVPKPAASAWDGTAEPARRWAATCAV